MKGILFSFAYCSAQDPAGAQIVNLELVQLVQNAPSPMLIKLAGSFTYVRFEQYLNANSPILVTPSGITTLFKLSHPHKA